jgi:hypothetical protein
VSSKRLHFAKAVRITDGDFGKLPGVETPILLWGLFVGLKPHAPSKEAKVAGRFRDGILYLLDAIAENAIRVETPRCLPSANYSAW